MNNITLFFSLFLKRIKRNEFFLSKKNQKHYFFAIKVTKQRTQANSVSPHFPANLAIAKKYKNLRYSI